MSHDEVAAKCRGSAEYAGWPRDKSEKIVEAVRTLETLAGLKAPSPLLAAENG